MHNWFVCNMYDEYWVYVQVASFVLSIFFHNIHYKNLYELKWVYAIKMATSRRNMRRAQCRNKKSLCTCVCVNKFSRNLMFQCNKLNAAIVLVGQSICCCRRRRHRNRRKINYINTTASTFGIASHMHEMRTW